MLRVVTVPFDKRNDANVYSQSNWDAEGGLDTFSTPLYDAEGTVQAYCCCINLAEDAVYADYMMVYPSIENAEEDLGLDLNDGGDED